MKFQVGDIVEVLTKTGTDRWVKATVAVVEATPDGILYTVKCGDNYFYVLPDGIRQMENE